MLHQRINYINKIKSYLKIIQLIFFFPAAHALQIEDEQLLLRKKNISGLFDNLWLEKLKTQKHKIWQWLKTFMG